MWELNSTTVFLKAVLFTHTRMQEELARQGIIASSMLMDAGTYAFERLILGTSMTRHSRQLYGQLRRLGLELPFNRSQESEADYLGLVFMSLSGYDTQESYKVWERMQEEMGDSGRSEFFSTHPSPKNRIQKLKEWIPEVRLNYPSIKT